MEQSLLISDDNIKKQVKILYTNYKGETSFRTVIPINIWYGSTDWHLESQWLLNAIDTEKKAQRSFALKDIKAWISE